MLNKLVPTILTTAACLLVLVGAALEIKEKSLPCERLPINVAPTEYQLELELPSLEAQTFQGHVNISLSFLHKKDLAYVHLAKGLVGETCKFKESNTIVLHADPSIELLDIAVSSESCGLGCLGQGEKRRAIRSIKRDSEKQLIAIKLWRGMNAGGTGQLSISFRGRMRNDKRGLYVSKHKEGNKEYKYLVTQFQPTDARTVFPVFDEPGFKARFQVNLIHPRGLTALSTTDPETKQDVNEALVRTTFEQTPLMSVHMLAFTVGQFDEPLEIKLKSKILSTWYAVRVFTAPGLRKSGLFALEVARRSLNYFEQYIDYQFPLKKFDLVAIPDLDKDNTENWGLSFIRDSLVWIDDETKPETNITTAVNVAHVCVHQWFANLVTAAWWNDLWITEGVAAQFAFHIVRKLYQDFESEYFVRLATLSGVMQLDAPGKLHALSPPLEELRTSEQIYGIFDNLEFMKSGSLAQMVNKWLDREQPNWYLSVVRTLVKNFAHQTINYEDYLATIKTFGWERILDRQIRLEDMRALISSFKSQRGVPLVNADLEGNYLQVDIEYMATARADLTMMPLDAITPALLWDDLLIGRASAEDNEKLGRHLAPTRPFSSEIDQLGVGKAVKYVKMGANPDINTYYRTRYSDADYASFCEPIRTRTMSAMHRLQILDDANQLMSTHISGKGNTLKSLVDCYVNEDNGAVLIQLLSALKTLAYLDRSSPSSKAIENIFEKYGFAVTGQETLLEQRSRSVALKALIEQGNQQVIGAALKAFDEAQGNVTVFLREPVYAAVVAHGTEAQMKVLLDKMRATKSHEEKVRLATALSFATDKKYLEAWLEWLKNDSGLKADITKPLIDKIDRL